MTLSEHDRRVIMSALIVAIDSYSISGQFKAEISAKDVASKINRAKSIELKG